MYDLLSPRVREEIELSGQHVSLCSTLKNTNPYRSSNRETKAPLADFHSPSQIGSPLRIAALVVAIVFGGWMLLLSGRPSISSLGACGFVALPYLVISIATRYLRSSLALFILAPALAGCIVLSLMVVPTLNSDAQGGIALFIAWICQLLVTLFLFMIAMAIDKKTD